MSEVIQVEVPTVGESISEVQIGKWLKSDGDWVAEGEDLVEIETERHRFKSLRPHQDFCKTLASPKKNSRPSGM